MQKIKYLVHFQAFVSVYAIHGDTGEGNLIQDSVILEAGKKVEERDLSRWGKELGQRLKLSYTPEGLETKKPVIVGPVSILNFNQLEPGLAYDA